VHVISNCLSRYCLESWSLSCIAPSFLDMYVPVCPRMKSLEYDLNQIFWAIEDGKSPSVTCRPCGLLPSMRAVAELQWCAYHFHYAYIPYLVFVGVDILDLYIVSVSFWYAPYVIDVVIILVPKLFGVGNQVFLWRSATPIDNCASMALAADFAVNDCAPISFIMIV
jgi:hypothetical protein